MYNLPYYKEQDQQVVLDFIRKHPFAMITGCTEENKPVATQIPVFIEEREDKLYLTGHIMKQTDHHKAFEKNANVLCVFTGPHSYVSATWYSNPHQASTWNYISIHVRGLLLLLDEQALIEILKKTTLHFEDNNPHSTTVFDNLPQDYRDRLMNAIIAFEIEVEEINNVFKLSQDRDKASYNNIKEHLNHQGEHAQLIASEMEKRTSQLFDSKN